MKSLVPWALGLCIGAASLAPVTASATAIYDVVVTYEGGYRYSFRMEFAEPPSTPVTPADLIGGDFTDETLTLNGTPFALDIDKPVDILNWAGGSSQLFAKSTDTFLFPSPTFSVFHQDTELIIVFPDLVFFAEGPPIISRVDTPSAIPVPATLVLFAAGLAGMWIGIRRASSRSMPSQPAAVG